VLLDREEDIIVYSWETGFKKGWPPDTKFSPGVTGFVWALTTGEEALLARIICFGKTACLKKEILSSEV